jgi:hypothetical protein
MNNSLTPKTIFIITDILNNVELNILEILANLQAEQDAFLLPIFKQIDEENRKFFEGINLD